MPDKPRVYWRVEDREGFDPDDSCWAVKFKNLDIGFMSWAEAYTYAFISAVMGRPV